MFAGTELFDGLPVAVYITDTAGAITYYNDAAAELWGRRPEPGSGRWCGSLRLYWPDGRPMPHEDCPLAVSLREGRPVRGVEALVERPDGRRVPFMPHPSLLRDAEGRVTGAINVLVDETDRKRAAVESARLAAIVTWSQDAIVGKTLDGVVTSWNAGAARMFGYAAEEMIGEPILRIIPPELRSDEARILARVRAGERVEAFDTVRVARDGRRVQVSLAVSPVRDAAGTVIGASKVARDITDRKQSEELQQLLVAELNHRVKNTLATIQAIARQSLRSQSEPRAFVEGFTGRIGALARAHELLVLGHMQGAELGELVREQVDLGTGDRRMSWSGPTVTLDAQTAVQMALVLHELATNARKYGALSVPSGRLAIAWTTAVGREPELRLAWSESGVPSVGAPVSVGFGTRLIERTLEANGGEAAIAYHADGLHCEIRLPLPVREAIPVAVLPAVPTAELAPVAAAAPEVGLDGRWILLVEDEPLIALEIEDQLLAAGCTVVGPANNLEAARRLIAETDRLDAALLDANLAGRRVDELAAELTRRGVPFAFATGYGREALPEGFGAAPYLAKPFDGDRLIAVVRALLAGPDLPDDVRALPRPRA